MQSLISNLRYQTRLPSARMNHSDGDGQVLNQVSPLIPHHSGTQPVVNNLHLMPDTSLLFISNLENMQTLLWINFALNFFTCTCNGYAFRKNTTM